MSTHRGPWRDTPGAAMEDALVEVNVCSADYVTCNYADGGFKLEPIAPDNDTAISADVTWSESREQYRVTLRQVPAAPREEEAEL